MYQCLAGLVKYCLMPISIATITIEHFFFRRICEDSMIHRDKQEMSAHWKVKCFDTHLSPKVVFSGFLQSYQKYLNRSCKTCIANVLLFPLRQNRLHELNYFACHYLISMYLFFLFFMKNWNFHDSEAKGYPFAFVYKFERKSNDFFFSFLFFKKTLKGVCIS